MEKFWREKNGGKIKKRREEKKILKMGYANQIKY
jgi:hypothetical protein